MQESAIRLLPAAFLLVTSACCGTTEKDVPISDTVLIGDLNQLSDNSGEVQQVDLNGNGFLDVGDTLRGTFDIQTREDLTPPNSGTVQYGTAGVHELSGIFEIVVTSKTFTGVGSDGVAGTGDDKFDFAFGPYSPFQGEFGLSGTSMVVFFEDKTPDYDRTGAIASAEATATDGTKVVEIGFTGDLDESWTSWGAPQDPSIGKFVPQATGLGAFNISLGVLFNSLFGGNVGVPTGCSPFCPGDGLVDISASGGSSGTQGSSTGYDVFDNVDFVFRPS